MSALSDYTDAVTALRSALATAATDAATVLSTAATAKVLPGDLVAAITMRIAQAKAASDLLSTDITSAHCYVDGSGLDILTR